MKHLSDQSARGIQLVVALLVGAVMMGFALDMVSASRYTLQVIDGPTVAAYSTSVPMLSLPLWIVYILLSLSAVGMSLYGSEDSNIIAKHLCIFAIVCCAGVMLISWTNLNASPILGLAPANFYIICIIVDVILAVVTQAQISRGRREL